VVYPEVFAGHQVVSTARFDEAQHAVSQVFLPNRLTLLERESELDMRLNAIQVGGVTAGYLRYGRDVRVVTVDAANIHVNIPLSGRPESRCGRMAPVRSGPGKAAVFTSGMPADIRWPGDCAQLCLMIDRADLERELAAMLGRSVTKPVEFAPGMDLTGGPARTWLDTVHLLVREAEQPDSPLYHPAAARHLQGLLINCLLLAQPSNYRDALMAPVGKAGPRAVREAIDLMEGHPERPWTPSLLASLVSTSVRSLHDGFRHTVDTSPMAYLREVRLNRARDELTTAPAGAVTVTEVAGRWGFAHLGRFASTYRDKFGEPPSATLRRQP
jgi:AraC-like DNA-binding protein